MERYLERQSDLQPDKIQSMKNFYMACQALSQELREAKPLGICKMRGYGSMTEKDGLRILNLKEAKET